MTPVSGQIWRDRNKRRSRPRYIRIVAVSGSSVRAVECTADGIELAPCPRAIRAERFWQSDYSLVVKVVTDGQ